MDSRPFLVDLYFKDHCRNSQALIDSGCLCHATISASLAESLDLPRIPIPSRTLSGVTHARHSQTVDSITHALIDVSGHSQVIMAYMIPNQTWPLILGLPWLQQNDVTILLARQSLYIGKSDITVRNSDLSSAYRAPHEISANAFATWTYRARTSPDIQVFKASLRDIELALKPKPKGDPSKLLPSVYRDFMKAFSRTDADILPPHRLGVDHEIYLEPGQHPPIGPLYGTPREELLLLRKTLIELLDKNFIRVSQSPASSPILFARKPGGGLRFCVDYRALNAITRKDHYPLPLIRETFRVIAKAK